jgi:hypothetical protein
MSRIALARAERSCLPGDCSLDDGPVTRIAISALSTDRCEISRMGEMLQAGRSVKLWIGALGPFIGIIATTAGEHCCVNFIEPIEARIVDHFVV